VTLHNASLVLIYILSAMENNFFFIFFLISKPTQGLKKLFWPIANFSKLELDIDLRLLRECNHI